jgi:hypothetical protein
MLRRLNNKAGGGSGMSKQTGRCLCGKVKFTILDQEDEIAACHCDMCLRWSAGPMFVLHCKGPVEFKGEEHIIRYKSSDWAERGFCGACGSGLFYHLLPTGEYMISPCALDDQSGLKFTNQIFIDEKPDWYAFSNETKNMTGAEIFAMFAPKDEDPARALP